MTPNATPENADAVVDGAALDLAALRDRYLEERDKRLRGDGEQQYIEVNGDYAHYYEQDPFAKPATRAAVAEEIEVAILGGGFAGLLAGAHLRMAGIDDFRILEMGSDFGGTWYWNRYPGVQCDIESYCYMPLLEELNYVPRDKYAYGPEIYEHCRRIGEAYDLYKAALFRTQVTALRWDGSMRRWHVTTNHEDEIHARFLIMATGNYNRPKLPGIPGINSFKGHSFHTCRWDYDYTGGDADGGLVKLSGKRVAVIGTGCSAIQCIPHVARHAEHLYVFQRTPSAVDMRGNRKTDPEWARSLQPGWQRERQSNFNAVAMGIPADEDLVRDGWTEIGRTIIAKVKDVGEQTPEALGELWEIEDFKRQERLRRRVDTIVDDRETAEALKAWYRMWCKRPTFSDDYLPTFNRPNVTLVDVTSSKGVERITEKGVVGNGVEHEVDCIIFASGFELTSELSRRIGISVIEGRDGRSLYDHWQDGFRTLHGLTTHGFPNQFFTGFTQGGISANLTSMLHDQAGHIAHLISETIRRGALTVESTEKAQDAWVATIRALEVSNEQFLTECTPGAYNNEGGPVRRSHVGDVYAPGLDAFNALLQEWRDKGDLEGLVLGR